MIAPKQESEIRTLFTIGYEGLDLPRFLKFLTCHRIQILVDVRELAFSRKKGFSKTALSGALTETGIRYVHLSKLGSPRDVRHALHDEEDYDAFFRAYRQHLEKQEDAIDELLDLIEEGTGICLMCFEKDHEKCHRSLLAEYVSDNYNGNLKVEPVNTWVK